MSGTMPDSSNATVPWWQPVLFTAMAGGLGWGIRGQYGHETGAMIAGVLVSLTLVFLLCPGIATIQVVRAAALGTVAMGIGGTMTYGVTLGLTQNPEVLGNWGALRWGMLGCAIKGAAWIGFAGLFLGIGLGGKRYTPLEMLLLLLAMLAAAYAGITLLNRPFDIETGRHPAIDFSSIGYWAPDTKSTPRAEYWGGLHFALLVGLAYCTWRKQDVLARNMGCWGLLGGALGFPLGQSLQAFHAWNPAYFADGFWGHLDPYMNWWNHMETTFGFIMGGALGLGLWLNRLRIDVQPEADEATLPLSLEVGLMLVHTFLIAWMAFFSGWAESLYDFGLVMAAIPFVCNIRGRIWPWFQVFAITLLPITASTVFELAIREPIIAPIPGWTLYFVLPLAIATGLAVYYARHALQGRTRPDFISIALLFNSWVYFGLNFAIFRYPWPWSPWTARTPNGIVFALFAVALTVMVWARRPRRTAGIPA